MRTVFVNGRFLTQPLTGVQRYACEVLRGIDELLEGSSDSARFRLILPPSARGTLGLRHIPEERVGRLEGHLWEQLDLPARAADGVLLSLNATGPPRHPRHLVTIHDAGVYANPGNFSLAFRAWYRTLIAFLRRSAAVVFTVSEFSKRELVEHCRIDESKIVVVHNGVDHVRREPGDATFLAENGLERGGYLLCVGADNPNKNIGLVVAALERLGRPGPLLVNVGAGNPRVFKSAEGRTALPLRNLGHVSDAALRSLYEGALCLVFPSFYEGFGIPPLEAMACGCPTVVARTSALPESCGDAALFCDPRDPRELVEHVRALSADAGLREHLRAAGLERAGRFTWLDTARRILDVAQSQAAA